ncbi:pre-mRNA-splicing factor CWC25-like [Odontomachus brunneus]|uniref:pre-mRNA-splicing factor CWC25-like n=1 Tax=Odontomachus brunneus TaxID=486640 RepID=UPI0013F2490F|nr:pre-mRNA-splicing factor CWC25-like [Odontomachus brunneus]
MPARRTPKIEALVVDAIRRLQDVQGSSSREISNYISQEYDVPAKDIRRQVQLVLQRGLSYGILRKTNRGYYTCSRDHLGQIPVEDEAGDGVMEPCPEHRKKWRRYWRRIRERRRRARERYRARKRKLSRQRTTRRRRAGSRRRRGRSRRRRRTRRSRRRGGTRGTRRRAGTSPDPNEAESVSRIETEQRGNDSSGNEDDRGSGQAPSQNE